MSVVIGLLLLGSPTQAEVKYPRYLTLASAGYVSASELSQLKRGMTLDEVRSLFGSPGKVTYTFDGSYSASMDITWYGNVRKYYDATDYEFATIEASFDADRGTRTETYYATVKKVNKRATRKKGRTVYRSVRVKRTREVPYSNPLRLTYASVTNRDFLSRATAPPPVTATPTPPPTPTAPATVPCDAPITDKNGERVAVGDYLSWVTRQGVDDTRYRVDTVTCVFGQLHVSGVTFSSYLPTFDGQKWGPWLASFVATEMVKYRPTPQ